MPELPDVTVYVETIASHVSGRVLEKSGMRHEGSLRQDVKKWDEYVDVEVYGILRSDRTP